MGNKQFVSECESPMGQDIMLHALRKKGMREIKERRTLKILMLGSGGSGKTTLLNQCSILFGNGKFHMEDCHVKWNRRYQIHMALLELLSACNDKVEPRNQAVATILKKENVSSLGRDFDYENWRRDAAKLWKDKYIQQAWMNKRHETAIPDGVEYFFNTINTAMDDSWVPTDQDRVLFVLKTLGHQSKVFKVRDDLEMQLWDTGGQLSERTQWSKLYDEHFDYILFVVNIADYNKKMSETGEGNRLVDSVELFGRVLSTQALQNVPTVLILNKTDLLNEKLKKFGDFKNYFPDYKGGSNDFEAVKSFIKEMYINQLSKYGDLASNKIFPYELNAIDTATVKCFFDEFTENL